MFESYRERIGAKKGEESSIQLESQKRKAASSLLDSPTLSHVLINMNEITPVPSIVSDIKTIYERRFLFLPEMNVNLGDYITHEGMTYLAKNKTSNKIYPQLFGELCNEEFPLEEIVRKVEVDKDSLGRPIFKTVKNTIKKPCVMTTKIYSQADNSPVPLPDGAVTVWLPYSLNPKEIPKLNQIVLIRGNQYKVTTVSYENVIQEVGTIEVRLQREPLSI